MRSENNTTELEPGYGVPSSLSTMSILRFHQISSNQYSYSMTVSFEYATMFLNIGYFLFPRKNWQSTPITFQIRDSHDWQSFSSRPLCQLTARSYWDDSSELFWIDLARYNPRVATPREVERRDAQITSTYPWVRKPLRKWPGTETNNWAGSFRRLASLFYLPKVTVECSLVLCPRKMLKITRMEMGRVAD